MKGKEVSVKRKNYLIKYRKDNHDRIVQQHKEYNERKRFQSYIEYNSFYFYGHYIFSNEYPNGILRYVGWGTSPEYRRAKIYHNQQPRWKDTFSGIKHIKNENGEWWEHRIIADNLTHKEVNQYEELFIKVFGKINEGGILVNKNSGGGGNRKNKKSDKEIINRNKIYQKRYKKRNVEKLRNYNKLWIRNYRLKNNQSNNEL